MQDPDDGSVATKKLLEPATLRMSSWCLCRAGVVGEQEGVGGRCGKSVALDLGVLLSRHIVIGFASDVTQGFNHRWNIEFFIALTDWPADLKHYDQGPLAGLGMPTGGDVCDGYQESLT